MAWSISPNGHMIERDGNPFFYLGDTAWLLFSRLTQEEGQTYLLNRALKGFTVIQATLIHSENYANPLGQKALLAEDFSRPDRDSGYWQGVLQLVRYAASLGLTMALLPSWGSFAKEGKLNPDNAESYARFLSEIFGNEENVIWLLGGDVRGDAVAETFGILGKTLKTLCPGQLISFHPFGRCDSSFWFHGEDWLDFHMFQSGHRDYEQRILNEWDDNAVFYGEDNYRYAEIDWALPHPKPTLDGEPSYEQIPHGLHDPSQPYWQAADVRRYAYWSLLSGSCGHTYGDNAIMQFHTGGIGAYGVKQTWQEALHNPGSGQMRHAKRLMQSIAWDTGRPCPEIFPEPQKERHGYHPALLTDRALAVYEYEGQSFSLNLTLIPFPRLAAFWMDPISGALSALGSIEKSSSFQFTPPDRKDRVNDWVLILMDEDKMSDVLPIFT